MSIKITIPNSSSDVLTFGSGNTPTAAQIAGIDSGSSNGQLALYTTASGTSTERVRVDASGNVGVGTSSPGDKLVVSATSAGSVVTLTRLLNAGTTTGTASRLLFTNNTDGSGGAVSAAISHIAENTSGAGALAFYTPTTGSPVERMRIDSSGNLLISRTAATSARLAIQTVDATSSNYAAIWQDSATINLFYVRNDGVGYLKAASWTYGSDISLKENVRYLDSNNSLSLITKAKPASFDYINSQKENYGFIAQDVQTWFPEAVVETEGGTLGLKTEFFIPLMVGSIQALNNLIQEQQAIITSLTDRITALEGAK